MAKKKPEAKAQGRKSDLGLAGEGRLPSGATVKKAAAKVGAAVKKGLAKPAAKKSAAQKPAGKKQAAKKPEAKRKK